MIVDGLSWWQSWLCVWIGYSLAALFVCLVGRIAAIYRIPFAVTNRASFGIWGSFWPVINRAAMAVIWYGVQVSSLIHTCGHAHSNHDLSRFDRHIWEVSRRTATPKQGQIH